MVQNLDLEYCTYKLRLKFEQCQLLYYVYESIMGSKEENQ